MMIIQAEAAQPRIEIAQETVIAIIAASTVVVLGLLWLIGHFASKAPEKEGPLYYGNFFVVIFGIITVLIGFLIAFPLVISNVFTDPTQVIALLSALFGTVVGLVGTYFGVKSSSDASLNAQHLSQQAQDMAREVTQRNVRPTDGTPDAKANGTPAEGVPRTAGSRTEPGKTVAQGDRTHGDPKPPEEKRKE